VLASRFNVWDMDFPLSIHHGSLAKTSRIAAERGLKTGELRTVVCTSSLELGIDIGSIDLVIQYNSPRQVTRLLQRVGRSGHRIGRRAKGVIVTINSDDTLESMVICRRALIEEMEPVTVPRKPYDVLVNQIVAELMPRGRIYFLQVNNLFSRAYPFADLTEDEVRFVARYMHNRFPRLAWVSEMDEVIIKPRGNRKTIYRYFFNNLSMIPDEKDYLVIDMDDDAPVGILHEAFVAEYAKPGVKFIIRGSPWKILNIYNDKIYVRGEDDPAGAIPSWVGEEIPVPLDVALEVGNIKDQVESGFKEGLSLDEVVTRLEEVYPAGRDTIARAISEIVEQVERGLPLPTDRRVVVEDWEENVIIHANFGSMVNRTLARLIGHLISEETGYPFKRRLINVARKAGALSKYANFSNITLGRLMKSFEGTCIFEEAMKDTMRKDLDVEATVDLLRRIARDDINVVKLEAGGEMSPMARVGIESISMKTDIVPPESMSRIIVESARARLLNETRILACLNCLKHMEANRMRNLPEELHCPKCGSTEMGIFDRSMEEVMAAASRARRGTPRKAARWWERGRDSSKLVSIYGRRAAIVAAAKRVDFTEAWDLLAETEGESNRFFERIVEAEREALKRRFI